MEKMPIAKSELRLLLNAEAFGFGPTAAIADSFPHLRKLFGKIGFVGKGHTHDLQKPLAYDCIHDLSGLSVEEEEEALGEIFGQYDVFLTALDFDMAEKAGRAGLWVAVYDPLTWYWKTIHPVVKACHLYIAQDFFGVRERMAEEADRFGRVAVVSPLVPVSDAWSGERRHVLLNLGGLNNPFWSAEDTLSYARLVVKSVVQSGAVKEPLIIAANATIAAELKEFGVRNFSRRQMQGVLAFAKYAFMTPGLGNIYDAAHHKVPTIWLPPANDSQGQQLKMLSAHKMADGQLDWPDFVPGEEAASLADYRGDQAQILKRITALVHDTAGSVELQKRFTSRLTTLVGTLTGPEHPGACTALTARFGGGGAEQLAKIVLSAAQKEVKCTHTT